MGQWAQRRHRGGSGSQVIVLIAPVLTALGDGDLGWTWSQTDPDHWLVENSADGISGWGFYSNESGEQRGVGGAGPPTFYRITGLDALDVPVTAVSNVVQQLT